MDLDDTVAVVTGAGSGVGRATALALAGRGCRVVANDLDPEAAQRIAAEIETAGGAAVGQPGDVAVDDDCRDLAARAGAEYGRLDLLVNNAGYTALVPHDDLEGVTDELWQRTLDVNLKGPFQCARAAAPALRAGGGGQVVNISSFAGVYGTGSSIPYCTSKAGLNLLTEMLARVLSPEIRVNAVAPGFIDGPWLRRAFGEAFDDVKALMEQQALLGRVNRPEDVSDAILAIVEGSDMVTGQVTVVDGGLGLAG
jgi:3-oxoacyl-[acyl-carrier protein] reductase